MQNTTVKDDKTPIPTNKIVWRNVIVFTLLHLSAAYGIYLVAFEKKYMLCLLAICLSFAIGQGITAGAHRLWAHRCYKVRLPLKLLLVFLQTSAFQNSILVWTRDHRLHHKCTDTNADPHNSKRGFFFSHMGWLFVRKHPDVTSKGKTIDISDITSDAILMWQHKYYYPLMIVCAFIIPTYFCHCLTGENISHCFAICGSLRYIYSVHMTWLVNSAAHIIGAKPYDRNSSACENMVVSHVAMGEGFHNYHHAFPWDYKAAELGHYSMNLTLLVINCFAKIGWAYDLKTVSHELVSKRALRTGDGNWLKKQDSFELKRNIQMGHKGWKDEELIWGWNDPNLPQEHRDLADVVAKSC